MQEIKCPKCGEVFQVDEAGYAAIVKQVRDKEFEKQMKERESALLAEHKAEVETAILKTKSAKDSEILNLKSEIAKMQSERQRETERAEAEKKLSLGDKEKEIIKLKAEIDAKEKDSVLAVKTAVREKETEIAKL